MHEGRHLPLSNPIFLLYSYAAELALKAFLQAKNIPTRGHGLARLYVKCHSHGLVIGPNDRVGIANIMSLLEDGNKGQGFRYFNSSSCWRPELSWVRETIADLIRAVEPHVQLQTQMRLRQLFLQRVAIIGLFDRGLFEPHAQPHILGSPAVRHPSIALMPGRRDGGGERAPVSSLKNAFFPVEAPQGGNEVPMGSGLDGCS